MRRMSAPLTTGGNVTVRSSRELTRTALVDAQVPVRLGWGGGRKSGWRLGKIIPLEEAASISKRRTARPTQNQRKGHLFNVGFVGKESPS